MSSSKSEARLRLALLALFTVPGWACATAINGVPSDSSPLAASGAAGSDSGDAGSSAIAGSSASAGSSGAPAAASSGASGAPPSAGAPGKGGSGGAGSAGSTGKGGADSAGGASAGTGSGGASEGGAGTSNAGTSAGGASAGTGSGGASEGGAGGGAICDAAHAVKTLAQQEMYTGKANDCVRLAVNTSWAAIAVKLQPQPGTAGYPIPFTFFNCGGNGTGSLTGDYAEAPLKSGMNPGCDFFVQFGGGDTTIKVTYFD